MLHSDTPRWLPIRSIVDRHTREAEIRATRRRKGDEDGLEVKSSKGRKVRKGKKEKKAHPFQNRKGRPPKSF
jgi:hypothetical protein